MTATDRVAAAKRLTKELARKTRIALHQAEQAQPHDWRAQHVEDMGTVATEHAGLKARYATPPLERYHARKIIDDAQLDAGRRLYDSWALGVCGARDPDRKTSGYWTGYGLVDAQVQALTEYRKAMAMLNPRMKAIVLWVCCEDKTVEAACAVLNVGRRQGDPGWMDRKQMMGVFKVALDTLADHYNERY